MAKEKYLFKEDHPTTYQDIKKEVEANLDSILDIKRGYFDDTAAMAGFQSLGRMDEQKQKEFVKFALFVDRKMNFAGQAKQNRTDKIPTILAGAIYYDRHYEEIMQYELKEQMLLAKFSVMQPLSFYDQASSNYPKELIKAIVRKERNYAFQEWYIELAENYLEKGWTPKEITDYINNNSQENLHKEYIEYDTKIMRELWEEGDKNASRRV